MAQVENKVAGNSACKEALDLNTSVVTSLDTGLNTGLGLDRSEYAALGIGNTPDRAVASEPGNVYRYFSREGLVTSVGVNAPEIAAPGRNAFSFTTVAYMMPGQDAEKIELYPAAGCRRETTAPTDESIPVQERALQDAPIPSSKYVNVFQVVDGEVRPVKVDQRHLTLAA